jgi:hypothetical protein
MNSSSDLDSLSSEDALHAALLDAHMTTVFNERDAEQRRLAISRLYNDDAKLFEASEVWTGQTAICEGVGRLLAKLPPGFSFTPEARSDSHHCIGYLRWQGAVNR